MSDMIHLILNETTFRGTDNVSTEVVAAFYTLQSAMDWIQDLAEEHGVYVEDDANSVYLRPEFDHVESDEYYIVEMEVSE